MRRRSRKRSTPASCNPSRRAVIKLPFRADLGAFASARRIRLAACDHPDVRVVLAHPARRSRRRRSGQPQTADPGRLHPARRARAVQLVTARPASAAQHRTGHPRRDERHRWTGDPISALLPRAPYETTNRWTQYGDSVFRLKDRRGNDYLLGPTHEELFTLTVKGEYSSYKDFPLTLYQIQTKYRDEARPRAGILRAREFVMKDSYSLTSTPPG